jgi:hypothetical protein
MLEDVQERLVYRTHIYIRQEILNYNPAEGDLAYPEKLQMMEVGILNLPFSYLMTFCLSFCSQSLK